MKKTKTMTTTYQYLLIDTFEVTGNGIKGALSDTIKGWRRVLKMIGGIRTNTSNLTQVYGLCPRKCRRRAESNNI